MGINPITCSVEMTIIIKITIIIHQFPTKSCRRACVTECLLIVIHFLLFGYTHDFFKHGIKCFIHIYASTHAKHITSLSGGNKRKLALFCVLPSQDHELLTYMDCELGSDPHLRREVRTPNRKLLYFNTSAKHFSNAEIVWKFIM